MAGAPPSDLVQLYDAMFWMLLFKGFSDLGISGMRSNLGDVRLSRPSLMLSDFCRAIYTLYMRGLSRNRRWWFFDAAKETIESLLSVLDDD